MGIGIAIGNLTLLVVLVLSALFFPHLTRWSMVCASLILITAFAQLLTSAARIPIAAKISLGVLQTLNCLTGLLILLVWHSGMGTFWLFLTAVLTTLMIATTLLVLSIFWKRNEVE